MATNSYSAQIQEIRKRELFLEIQDAAAEKIQAHWRGSRTRQVLLPHLATQSAQVAKYGLDQAFDLAIEFQVEFEQRFAEALHRKAALRLARELAGAAPADDSSEDDGDDPATDAGSVSTSTPAAPAASAGRAPSAIAAQHSAARASRAEGSAPEPVASPGQPEPATDEGLATQSARLERLRASLDDATSAPLPGSDDPGQAGSSVQIFGAERPSADGVDVSAELGVSMDRLSDSSSAGLAELSRARQAAASHGLRDVLVKLKHASDVGQVVGAGLAGADAGAGSEDSAWTLAATWIEGSPAADRSPPLQSALNEGHFLCFLRDVGLLSGSVTFELVQQVFARHAVLQHAECDQLRAQQAFLAECAAVQVRSKHGAAHVFGPNSMALRMALDMSTAQLPRDAVMQVVRRLGLLRWVPEAEVLDEIDRMPALVRWPRFERWYDERRRQLPALAARYRRDGRSASHRGELSAAGLPREAFRAAMVDVVLALYPPCTRCDCLACAHNAVAHRASALSLPAIPGTSQAPKPIVWQEALADPQFRAVHERYVVDSIALPNHVAPACYALQQSAARTAESPVGQLLLSNGVRAVLQEYEKGVARVFAAYADEDQDASAAGSDGAATPAGAARNQAPASVRSGRGGSVGRKPGHGSAALDTVGSAALSYTAWRRLCMDACIAPDLLDNAPATGFLLASVWLGTAGAPRTGGAPDLFKALALPSSPLLPATCSRSGLALYTLPFAEAQRLEMAWQAWDVSERGWVPIAELRDMLTAAGRAPLPGGVPWQVFLSIARQVGELPLVTYPEFFNAWQAAWQVHVRLMHDRASFMDFLLALALTGVVSATKMLSAPSRGSNASVLPAQARLRSASPAVAVRHLFTHVLCPVWEQALVPGQLRTQAPPLVLHQDLTLPHVGAKLRAALQDAFHVYGRQGHELRARSLALPQFLTWARDMRMFDDMDSIALQQVFAEAQDDAGETGLSPEAFYSAAVATLQASFLAGQRRRGEYEPAAWTLPIAMHSGLTPEGLLKRALLRATTLVLGAYGPSARVGPRRIRAAYAVPGYGEDAGLVHSPRAHAARHDVRSGAPLRTAGAAPAELTARLPSVLTAHAEVRRVVAAQVRAAAGLHRALLQAGAPDAGATSAWLRMLSPAFAALLPRSGDQDAWQAVSAALVRPSGHDEHEPDGSESAGSTPWPDDSLVSEDSDEAAHAEQERLSKPGSAAVQSRSRRSSAGLKSMSKLTAGMLLGGLQTTIHQQTDVLSNGKRMGVLNGSLFHYARGGLTGTLRPPEAVELVSPAAMSLASIKAMLLPWHVQDARPLPAIPAWQRQQLQRWERQPVEVQAQRWLTDGSLLLTECPQPPSTASTPCGKFTHSSKPRVGRAVADVVRTLGRILGLMSGDSRSASQHLSMPREDTIPRVLARGFYASQAASALLPVDMRYPKALARVPPTEVLTHLLPFALARLSWYLLQRPSDVQATNATMQRLRTLDGAGSSNAASLGVHAGRAAASTCWTERQAPVVKAGARVDWHTAACKALEEVAQIGQLAARELAVDDSLTREEHAAMERKARGVQAVTEALILQHQAYAAAAAAAARWASTRGAAEAAREDARTQRSLIKLHRLSSRVTLARGARARQTEKLAMRAVDLAIPAFMAKQARKQAGVSGMSTPRSAVGGSTPLAMLAPHAPKQRVRVRSQVARALAGGFCPALGPDYVRYVQLLGRQAVSDAQVDVQSMLQRKPRASSAASAHSCASMASTASAGSGGGAPESLEQVQQQAAAMGVSVTAVLALRRLQRKAAAALAIQAEAGSPPGHGPASRSSQQASRASAGPSAPAKTGSPGSEGARTRARRFKRIVSKKHAQPQSAASQEVAHSASSTWAQMQRIAESTVATSPISRPAAVPKLPMDALRIPSLQADPHLRRTLGAGVARGRMTCALATTVTTARQRRPKLAVSSPPRASNTARAAKPALHSHSPASDSSPSSSPAAPAGKRWTVPAMPPPSLAVVLPATSPPHSDTRAATPQASQPALASSAAGTPQTWRPAPISPHATFREPSPVPSLTPSVSAHVEHQRERAAAVRALSQQARSARAVPQAAQQPGRLAKRARSLINATAQSMQVASAKGMLPSWVLRATEIPGLLDQGSDPALDSDEQDEPPRSPRLRSDIASLIADTRQYVATDRDAIHADWAARHKAHTARSYGARIRAKELARLEGSGRIWSNGL